MEEIETSQLYVRQTLTSILQHFFKFSTRLTWYLYHNKLSRKQTHNHDRL